jgi:N-carbamoyl-L-amino-acid hydrolase
MDSVPNGGWLDGCLNVLAGAEVLRRIADEGTPPVTVRLVDWADEEGARFGRSPSARLRPRTRWRTRTSCASSRTETASRFPTRSAPTASTSTGRSMPTASSRPRPRTSSSTSSRAPCSSRSTSRSGSCSARSAWSATASPGRARPRTRARPRWTSAATRSRARRSSPSRSATSRARRATAPCAPRAASSAGRDRHLGRGDRGAAADQRHSTQASSPRCSRAQELSRGFAEEERIDVAWERIWSIEPILSTRRSSGSPTRRSTRWRARRTGCRRGHSHDAAEVSRDGIPPSWFRPEPARPLAHEAREYHEARAPRASVAALDRLASKTIDWVAAR